MGHRSPGVSHSATSARGATNSAANNEIDASSAAADSASPGRCGDSAERQSSAYALYPATFSGPRACRLGSEPRASGTRFPHPRRCDGTSSPAERPHYHPRMELPDAHTGHVAYWQADRNPSPSRSGLASSRNLPSHFHLASESAQRTGARRTSAYRRISCLGRRRLFRCRRGRRSHVQPGGIRRRRRHVTRARWARRDSVLLRVPRGAQLHHVRMKVRTHQCSSRHTP